MSPFMVATVFTVTLFWRLQGRLQLQAFKQFLNDKQGRILVVWLVLKKREGKHEGLKSETCDTANGTHKQLSFFRSVTPSQTWSWRARKNHTKSYTAMMKKNIFFAVHTPAVFVNSIQMLHIPRYSLFWGKASNWGVWQMTLRGRTILKSQKKN